MIEYQYYRVSVRLVVTIFNTYGEGILSFSRRQNIINEIANRIGIFKVCQ